jgi:hypothetical protein
MLHDHRYTDRNRTPESPLLQIKFFRANAAGELECIAESKPSCGGNHISRIFSELDELLSCGWTAAELLGATVRTYTDGKQEGSATISQADLTVIEDRRARIYGRMVSPAEESSESS